MEIGVVKEIKDKEYRVGLSPDSVQILTENNIRVFVQTQAGVGAGFTDQDYQLAGATIVESAAAAWQRELIVKVKEPLPTEYKYLNLKQILFTYLHLAADRVLTENLLQSGVTAIAYETVTVDGKLPLLMPMSMIAGRLSVQFGAHYLEKSQSGRGVLLGGIPGVPAGRVVILGGGVVGTEAAKIALGMGAKVQILDINLERLATLETVLGSGVELLYSCPPYIERAVREADLLIGAVLLPGKRPPLLVPRSLVAQMVPGSVIVDVAVDQGGCIETMRPTSHSHPTYIEEGVVHVGIPNMPGAVPWTATQALNHSILPYVLQLAKEGTSALDKNGSLRQGLNIRNHQLVHPAVQEVFPDLV